MFLGFDTRKSILLGIAPNLVVTNTIVVVSCKA